MLLPKCSSLTYFNPYNNQFGNEGAKALAVGVAASSPMATLNLSNIR